MKRGQVTIFIIAAVALVAIIAAIFLIRTDAVHGIGGAPEKNPNAFIKLCIEDEMRENIDLMISQGGFLDPVNFRYHEDIKATYLCDHIGSYTPCINQHPMYLSQMSGELEGAIENKIDECFTEYKEALENDGYDVSMDDETDMSLNMVPGQVTIELVKDITISKGEETNTYDKVSLVYKTPIYNLARVAMEIVNEEALTCLFGHLNYMSLHPEYLIELKTLSDSTKIYSITYKETGDKMNIAIRGCALV